MGATFRVVIANVGAAPDARLFGADGNSVGVGFPADMSQHVLRAGDCSIVTGD